MKLAKISSVSLTFKQAGFILAMMTLGWLCLTPMARANIGASLLVQLGDRRVEMINMPDRHLMISKGCKTKNGFNCQAFSAFAHTKKSLKHETKTPPELGAEVCVQAHGAVKVGTTTNHDEITLCFFAKDQSYIDIGSLYAQTQGY